MGRPRATAGHVRAPAGATVAPGRARREVVLEGGRRLGDGLGVGDLRGKCRSGDQIAAPNGGNIGYNSPRKGAR